MTESNLVELLRLRTMNYLIDDCSIEMSKLQQNGSGHAFILATCHVCNELAKFHGLEFHGRKIIIEEAKTPHRTLVNELSRNAVANDQESMHKMPPAINGVGSSLPKAPTEEQHPIHNINSVFSNAVIPKKKIIAHFGTLTSRYENETSKFSGERRKNTLKSIPWRHSQSVESLRHFSVRGIRL